MAPFSLFRNQNEPNTASSGSSCRCRSVAKTGLGVVFHGVWTPVTSFLLPSFILRFFRPRGTRCRAGLGSKGTDSLLMGAGLLSDETGCLPRTPPLLSPRRLPPMSTFPSTVSSRPSCFSHQAPRGSPSLYPLASSKATSTFLGPFYLPPTSRFPRPDCFLRARPWGERPPPTGEGSMHCLG